MHEPVRSNQDRFLKNEKKRRKLNLEDPKRRNSFVTREISMYQPIDT